MDDIDRSLLQILAADSGSTATEISKKVNLSIPAVNKRIARMRENGTIERFTIQVNAQAVGKGVQAFILVTLNQYALAGELLDYVQRERDILDCYAVTGEYDYLLRVCARDIEDLESKLLTLKSKHCVAKSYTMFTLMNHKQTPGPLPD